MKIKELKKSEVHCERNPIQLYCLIKIPRNLKRQSFVKSNVCVLSVFLFLACLEYTRISNNVEMSREVFTYRSVESIFQFLIVNTPMHVK